MINRVSARLQRPLYEVPVGFKWFVEGLLAGRLGFGGEESAGSSFLRRDGSVWTTDKDGIIPCLLSAEITARVEKDPGEIYRELTQELGDPVYERIEAPATPEQKTALERLSPSDIHATEVAGEQIEQILSTAPGDGKQSAKSHIRRATCAGPRPHQIAKGRQFAGLCGYLSILVGPFQTTIKNPNSS